MENKEEDRMISLNPMMFEMICFQYDGMCYIDPIWEYFDIFPLKKWFDGEQSEVNKALIDHDIDMEINAQNVSYHKYFTWFILIFYYDIWYSICLVIFKMLRC